jgi:hypothetical protein
LRDRLRVSACLRDRLRDICPVGGFAFGTVVRAISNTGVCKIAKRKPEELTITIPVPMPTWNRILSAHHYQRKVMRDCMDEIVKCAVEGKEPSELCVAKYMAAIRPSAKNKEKLAKLKKNK